MVEKKLQPMDFFCTQGSGFIGWSIRRITKNISPDRIKQELARRFDMSGIAEKDSRDN